MEKQAPSLLPKNNLLNEFGTQPLQCSICYDKSVHFMQCTGPCRQVFCLHCITNIKRRHNSCPSRCSKVFQVESLPLNSILFQCPFNKDKCKTMASVKEFKIHSSQCPYMNPSDLNQLRNKAQYRCVKGHQLIFLKYANFSKHFTNDDFYEFIQQQVCIVCQQKNLSRSICKQCSESPQFYCMQCRPLPVSKIECAFGHELMLSKETQDYQTLCDYCGGSILFCDQQYYSDGECDLDICKRCYEGCGDKIARKLKQIQQPLPKKIHKMMHHGNGSVSSESSDDPHDYFFI